MAVNTEILENIGLTKSEIKVYLALLELGSTTTGPIVDKSGASSSKIYEVLDRLIQKGLVSFIIKKGTKYFEAADPKRILDYLKEKEAKLKLQENEITNILPELELKKQLSKYKSEAQIYKGIKGVENTFNTMLDELQKGEEYYVLGASWMGGKEKVQHFFVDFHNRRQKKGVKAKLLFVSGTETMVEKHKKSYKTLGDYKFLPEGSYQGLQMNIYKNKLLIFVWREKEPIVFSIEDKTVHDTFKVYFDSFWNQTTRTYEGLEAIKKLLIQALDFGNYDVFAEGMKFVDILGEEFFVWWQNEKKKRKLKCRGIMGSRYKTTTTVTKSITEFRFIDGYENPGVTFMFDDKLVVMILTKEPVAFLIDNKEATESQRTYFNLLWESAK